MWRTLLDWWWPIRPRPRVVARLNTVDLYGDVDDVELVIGIKREFDMTITDAEAERA